jgi:hypothetical protein
VTKDFKNCTFLGSLCHNILNNLHLNCLSTTGKRLSTVVITLAPWAK